MVKMTGRQAPPEMARPKISERIERMRGRADRCAALLMETMESVHGAMLREAGEAKARLAEAECRIAETLGKL